MLYIIQTVDGSNDPSTLVIKSCCGTQQQQQQQQQQQKQQKLLLVWKGLYGGCLHNVMIVLNTVGMHLLMKMSTFFSSKQSAVIYLNKSAKGSAYISLYRAIDFY